MKNSLFKCLWLVSTFLCFLTAKVEAQNIEVGRVHQDCMWFTCYKSYTQSHWQGGSPYWDYVAEFNRTDEYCDGDHPHYLPDFVEFEGLKYRVIYSSYLLGSFPNRMIEQLDFSTYNGLRELYIPEESCVSVSNLPDISKLKIDNGINFPTLYAPKLKSLNIGGRELILISQGIPENQSINSAQRSFLRRHDGYNHLRVASISPLNPEYIRHSFYDCPEFHTLILGYAEPPEFRTDLIRYSDMYYQRDEKGRMFYIHPREEHDGHYDYVDCCVDHCDIKEPGEKVYVNEISDMKLIVPVGSLEKYKNAPGWSDFGEIIEGVDNEGIPLVSAWNRRYLYFTEEKPQWIHDDDWSEWMLLKNGSDVELENLSWTPVSYFIKDGIIYIENEHGEAEIVGPSNRDSSSYSLSSYVENNGRRIPVTKIRGFAFANFKHLNKDAIPATIREIGNYSFYNAKLDERYNNRLGDGPIQCYFENVKKVGRFAFAECAINTEWTASHIHPYYEQPMIEWIGRGAFYNTKFYDFSSSYANNIVLPRSIKHIGTDGFINGEKNFRPRTIKLSENLDYVGGNAFEWGAHLDMSDLRFQETPYNFFGTGNYISSSSSTFLTNNIRIPESVRLIYGRVGDISTNNCRSTSKLTLGKNVESVQPYAFTLKPGEDGKCVIYSLAQNPPLIWEESFNKKEGKIFDIEIHVPVGRKTVYGMTKWRDLGSLVDDLDFVEFEDGLFTYQLNQTDNSAKLIHLDVDRYSEENDMYDTLIIPSEVFKDGVKYEVTSIGSWATGESDNYKAWNNIVLPETVKNIEPYAFPFSFNENVSKSSLVCKSSVPPVIEAEHAFGWPYAIEDLKYDKYADLYVPDESLEDYKNNKHFNSLFRILPLSEVLTGLNELNSSNFDWEQPFDVFSIDGVLLKSEAEEYITLNRGVYIFRQGEKIKKVRI